MSGSHFALSICCLWLSFTYTVSASPTLKRPGDADWIAPSAKYGPPRRPSNIDLQTPARHTSTAFESLETTTTPSSSLFTPVSRPLEEPTSPRMLDRLWNQAGGQEELGKFFDYMRQGSNVPSVSIKQGHTFDRPPNPSNARFNSLARMRGLNRSTDEPQSKSRMAAKVEYQKQKAIKRLHDNPNAFDLLSQVQRARYMDSPPSPKRVKTQQSFRTASSVSILKQPWLFPSLQHPWNFKVSSKEEIQIKNHFKYYTVSDFERDYYLEGLTPYELRMLARNKPGSEAVKRILRNNPPPQTWSNINHDEIRQHHAYDHSKDLSTATAESLLEQMKKQKGKSQMIE